MARELLRVEAGERAAWSERLDPEGLEMANQVCIGSSMRIEGELMGSEDLVIDGTVHGKIRIAGHQLTIGENAKVLAEIHDARSVIVRGEMKGNIAAEDKIEIGSTGSVEGDIKAPRVVLSDGARFKGSIDMGSKVTSGNGNPRR